ncbi:MAG: hypothetical protein IPJ79_15890 [Bacteroidetes bacterium]|nr:hypothetical protein [Bacteroidota bacterium]HNR19128.1 hypothetical protein [Bacteroidia bacterium]HNU33684.1 hypothetical protein [Bacteroidia bacterium]
MFIKLKVFTAAICLTAIASHAQTLKDAIRLTDNEQYDVADGMYKQLIQKEPANANNWFYLGENYWNGENQDSAKICYEKGLQVDAANPLNSVGVGKALLETGQGIEARKNFDKALAASGGKTTTVQAEVAKAYIRSKFKDLNYASTLLNNAISVEPKNAELYILLGDVYTEKNDGTNAAINYNKALELDKNSVKAIVRKGVLYKRSTNFEGAAAEFINAISVDANFAPAHRELAETYFKQRKFEDAKAEYRKFLELSKNNTKARLRYASFLFLSEDYAAVLTELNQIGKVDSSNVNMMRMFAYTYHEMKDSVKATQTINKVFEKVAEEKRTVLDNEYKGKIESKNGNDSLGVTYLWKAYEVDSTKTDLLIDIGNTYMKMKKYADAERAFSKRVENGKGIKSADYFSLGRAAFFSKNYILADSAYAKVTELQTTWPNGFLWRAKTNTMIDSTSTQGLAKPYYEKFIELAQADSANLSRYKTGLIEAYRYLAVYNYKVAKSTDESKSFYKKILELDPADKNAQDAMRIFNAPPTPPNPPSTPKK